MRGLHVLVVLVWLQMQAGLGWATCQDGETWKQGCNFCGCHQGQPTCTDLRCSSPLCEEGKSWTADCNRCSCVNGQAVCTLRACPPKPTLDSYYRLDGKDCTPGARFSIKCNTCTCSEEGVARCTRLSCQGTESESRKSKCTRESVWKNDCNYCYCNEDGKAICTQRTCLTDGSYLPECTGEDGYWRDSGCGNCRCLEGAAACTDIKCTPEVISTWEREMQCHGDVTWKQGCNECHCANGVIVCTEKACTKG